MFVRHKISAAVLFLSVGFHAFAQAPEASSPSVEDPLLASLVEEALQTSPRLGAAEEALSRARLVPHQARALPDPMVAVGYQNDGWAPSLGTQMMSLLRLGWTQQLPYPGKRGLRNDIALRDIDRASQSLERVRLDLVASVKRAYYGVVQARRLLQLLDEEETIWSQIEAVARTRYSVGQGVQQDVIRIQIEITRIEQRRAELEAEAALRLAELNALTGRAPSHPLETSATLSLRPLDATLPRCLEEARSVSPELQSAEIGIDQARLTVSLTEKDKKPDFVLGAAYMNRGSLPSMWEAEVGVNLPLFRERLASAVGEAQAVVRQSEQLLEAVDLELRLRTEQRHAQIKAQERIAELYEEGIIPQDRVSVEAALATYRVGAVPFTTVLEAVFRLYGDREAHIRTVAAHEELRAILESASLESEMLPTTLEPFTAIAGRSSPAANAMR